MNKKNELVKNTLLLSIGTALVKVLQFIMVPIFTAWITVSDYGTFDLVCTYITLLIPIITFSVGQAIFRFLIDEDSKNKKKIISSGLALYLLNIAIVTIIILFIKKINGWEIAVPFALLFASQTINDYFQGYVRGEKKLHIYSFCMIISTALIALFSTIFIRCCNLGLNGLLYGYALGYFSGDILIFISTKFWNKFSIRSIKINTIINLIKYSYMLIFNDISWWIVNVSDRSLIRIFLGPVENGIYAIANKIPSLCSSVFNMFSISWQQTASEMANDSSRDKFINDVYNSSTATIISLCIGIISCNFIFFNYIFTQDYYLASFQTPILTFSIIFNCMSQFLGGIQISFKNPKENGISTVLAAVINIIINLALIKFIGLYAASISTLISNIFIVTYRKYRLKKKITLKLNKEVKLYFACFIYFFVCQYVLNNNLIISYINLFLAFVLFIYINKSFLNKIINRFIRRK